MPPAVSIQSLASSGVRNPEEDGGVSARRAVTIDEDSLMGAKASTVDAKAIRIARLEDEAFMVVVFYRYYL